MKKQLLLTHDQLVDWLIYHCPLIDTGLHQTPFSIWYYGHGLYGAEPLALYQEVAEHIVSYDRLLHKKITDLYWYWTI
jgi:hypothetical protein